jgi:hypothetical protein
VLVHGCEPLDAGLLHRSAATLASAQIETETHNALAEVLGRRPTNEETSAATEGARRHLRSRKSSDVLLVDELEHAVVVSAEEVADYMATLPDIADVVSSVAPPFERTFLEFQHRSNVLGFDSWGVLIEGTPTDDGWHLDAALIGEFKKGKPVGPLVRWAMPLDREGFLRPGDEEGYGSIFVRPLDVPDVPDNVAFEFADSLASLLGSALLTISLLHCKNVDVRLVDPPERLSRKHERNHGRPLTRYHVLDIQPMRSVLDRDGEAQTKGLRHALHICRGHFKTYTEDSPLFGKHTGTYWWAAQARGAADEGVIEKDYRIRLDQGFGREYVRADEHPGITPNAPEHTGLDPDLGGRGLQAHNITQNLLAAAVEEAGYVPRRPKPDEPQYDIAWEAGEVVWVAEVKSITRQNETRQLRHAVGQVLHYRHLLAAEGTVVRAMIAVERAPSDPTLVDLCGKEEIALVWPGNMNAVGSSV